MLEFTINDSGNEVVLQFEHSLFSLSKWEAKHQKPWFASAVKGHEELIDYFGYMLLTPGYKHDIVLRMSPAQHEELTKYISDPQTASSVPSDGPGRGGMQEMVTTELVYAWMTMLKINWEAQHWHYNRLMMVVSMVNFKQQPEKKQDKRKLYDKWREIQAQNREKFGLK